MIARCMLPVLLLLVVLLLLLPHPTEATGICLIQYLLADNNLEAYIRQDLEEWISSPAIRGGPVTSWVYWDSQNFEQGNNNNNNNNNAVQDPLPNVWTSDGSQLLTDSLTVKHEASYYLTYDLDLDKMVAHTILEDEQNGDDPAILQAYMETALTDCVGSNRTEIFVLFSSHGNGFAGFGGDQNKGARQLRQSNANLATALQNALTNVQGTPQHYTVIGFDACLMQGLGVVDDYQNITQYFIASEAVEPGHGWAYGDLQSTDSAVELARNIIQEYIANPQQTGRSRIHRTPKLLSMVDTTKYTVFLQGWNDLCGEFLSILQAGSDGDFLAALHRSRSQAIAFPSALDERGEKQPTALDIGDFLTTFANLCNPLAESTLSSHVQAALTAYNAMFDLRQVGPGTKAGTGMHVTWPHRQTYQNHKDKIDLFLLETSDTLYVGAPNYVDFLKAYLNGVTTSAIVTESVCQFGATGDLAPSDDEILLLNPSLQVVSEFLVQVQSDLVQETDLAIVEYGMDIQSFIFSERFRERRKKTRSLHKKTSPRRPPGIRPTTRTRRRRLQQGNNDDDDLYFVVFGGDVQGNYSGPSYQANWNRRFYFLHDSTTNDDAAYETVFVYDEGPDGARSIPVLYFPPDTQVHQTGAVDFGTSWEEGEDQLGGLYGFLTFSIDPSTQQPMDNLVLFTAQDNSEVSPLQETPRSASGSIAPMVFVDGYLDPDDNFPVDTLVGGFNGTVFAWNEVTNLAITTVTDVEYQQYFDADTIVIDIYAYDFDVPEGELEDWVSFDVLTKTNPEEEEDEAEEPSKEEESSAYRALQSTTTWASMLLSLIHQLGWTTVFVALLCRVP